MKSLTLVVLLAVIAFAWAQECQTGQNKVADDGCNNCVCANGVWACTQRFCVNRNKRQADTETCADNDTKQQDCNTCKCVSGKWACTRRACPPGPRTRRSTPDNCTPGERFKDDCNMCTCGPDGRHAACTLSICPPSS